MRDGIPTLDLFSGIGGFALGLKPVCRTIAYCEIRADSRQVLTNNMKRNLLDRAPIFEDVESLDFSLLNRLRPQLLTAGSPCQDISGVIGSYKGLSGTRTKLVNIVFDVLDNVPSIDHVMLENSDCVVVRGFHSIIDAFVSRGFDVAYGNFSAREAGAPHMRNRFFCLASRNPDSLKKCGMRPFDWTVEPVPRVVLKTPSSRRMLSRRWFMLGNAVVPQVVALAFNNLALALRNEQVTRIGKRCIRVIRPTSQGLFVSLERKSVQKHNKIITPSIDLGHGVTKTLWATPVAGFAGFCRANTERCAKNLGHQIMHDQKTKEVFKYQGVANHQNALDTYIPNVQFVEWLMGFPHGYTDINLI